MNLEMRYRQNLEKKKQTKPQEGLSISDAKKEISKYYGIPEEGIEIILRG